MSWVRTSIHWWWFNLHDSLVWSLKEWNAELLMPRKNQNYLKGSWQILRSNLWRFPALTHLLILGAYIHFYVQQYTYYIHYIICLMMPTLLGSPSMISLFCGLSFVAFFLNVTSKWNTRELLSLVLILNFFLFQACN